MNVQGGTERRARTIDRVELCDLCLKRLGDEWHVSIGQCYECARVCCTCWLERGHVEGDEQAKLFCMESVPGTCA